MLLLCAAYLVAAAGPVAATCGDGTLDAGEQCDDGNTSADDCCAADCAVSAPDGSSCNDDRSCTADDACQRGVCSGAPAGPLCASRLDRFVCYAARGRGFAARRGEALTDEFRLPTETPQRLDLRSTGFACSAATPSEAGGSVPAAARTHLEGYRARWTRGTPRGARTRRLLQLEDALGTLTLKLAAPARVLVPSTFAPLPGAAAAPAAPLPRFTCYRATQKRRRRASANGDTFRPGAVELTDLRGGPVSYLAGPPTALCVSERVVADSEVASPSASAGYLVCHRAKPVRGHSNGSTTVASANRYGRETLRLGREREVCLPAVVPVRPPGSADDERAAFGFLRDASPAGAAMTRLWRLGFRNPRSTAEADAALSDELAATAALRANLPAVQALLATAVRELPVDDVLGWASLDHLLGLAGDAPTILERLRDVTVAAPAADQGHDTPPDALVRQQVVRLLGRHARSGSDAARDRLLDAAAAPDAAVQAAAVRWTYAASRDRRLAQRDLRQRLGAAKQYLLYVE